MGSLSACPQGVQRDVQKGWGCGGFLAEVCYYWVEEGGGGVCRADKMRSPPAPQVCMCGRRAAAARQSPRWRRVKVGVWGGAAKARRVRSGQSMLSMQQFPALPAEEERYRQVLSANRVRRARGRSPPRVGPPGGHGLARAAGSAARPPPGAACSGGDGREKGSAAAGPAGNPPVPSRPAPSRRRALRAACAAAAGPSGRLLGQAAKGRALLRAPRSAAARAAPCLAAADGAASPGGGRGRVSARHPPAAGRSRVGTRAAVREERGGGGRVRGRRRWVSRSRLTSGRCQRFGRRAQLSRKVGGGGQRG